MATLYFESQYFTTTLSVAGGIDDSQTDSIVLQSVTGIHDTSKPGIALFSYADPLDTSVAEWLTFTSINSTTKTLVGVTRGAEGFSAKAHGNGVTIAFPHSKSHINALIQQFTDELTAVRTFTNKRNTKRVDSQVTTDTITPEPSTYDKFVRTAQAHDLVINNHSTSTPTDGELMLFELICDATPRALTYGDKYLAKAGTALPTTLVASKCTTLLFEWSAALSGWNLLAVGQEA